MWLSVESSLQDFILTGPKASPSNHCGCNESSGQGLQFLNTQFKAALHTFLISLKNRIFSMVPCLCQFLCTMQSRICILAQLKRDFISYDTDWGRLCLLWCGLLASYRKLNLLVCPKKLKVDINLRDTTFIFQKRKKKSTKIWLAFIICSKLI